MAEAQRIIATILGCGSSGGVPRIGNVWGLCDPENPRNRRRRCALLLEGWSEGSAEPTRIVVDTGCDLREQMLDARVDRVEAVFYTHEHADHTHGIDDLRVLALNNRKRVDVYFTQEAGDRIREAFGYGAPHFPLAHHYATEGEEWMYGRGSHDRLTDSGDWRERLILREHRYMREDLRVGLSFFASVAALAGVATPLMTAFLAIGGAVCGEDFLHGGRTLRLRTRRARGGDRGRDLHRSERLRCVHVAGLHGATVGHEGGAAHRADAHVRAAAGHGLLERRKRLHQFGGALEALLRLSL